MDPVTFAKLWLIVRPVKRIKAWRTRRKMRSWYAEHGRPVDEVLEDFHPVDEVSMDAVKGALKSKLVWLGLVQLAYSLFETWANGGLNAEAVSTAIAGAMTIVFRAVTSKPLADKA